MNYLEIIIAIASAIIAGSILWATIRQGIQTRQHNEISVRPLLSIRSSVEIRDDRECANIELVNAGFGPAIIRGVVLFVDDIKVSQSYYHFAEKKLKDCYHKMLAPLEPGVSIKANENYLVISVEYVIGGNTIDFFDKLAIRIYYQSMYEGEVFMYDTRYDREITVLDPHNRLTAQTFADIHAACFTIPRPWEGYEFSKLLQDPTVFHIKHEHGFAMGQSLDDTETELLTFAIIPQEQGKGYGRTLLNDFIAEVKRKNGQSIFLEVAENNAHAVHLYEQAGFKKISTRPAYYKVPGTPAIDAVVMRLDITE